MTFDIVLDHLIRNVAGGTGEVTTRPHSLAPVVLLQNFKLPLHLVAGVPLDPLNELADCDLGRDRYEYVDVVGSNDSADDLDVHLRADLTGQVSKAVAYRPTQHPLAVLRRPHQVQMDAKDAVAAMSVLAHNATLTEHAEASN